MKYSKQRELVYTTVKGLYTHPTADEVYNIVKNDCPNISLATVYRNLNLLAESHLLRKIPVANSSDRFDGRTDDHCHMLCDACGEVYDLEFHGLPELEETIEKKTGFEVLFSDLIIRGNCKNCRKKVVTEAQ